MSVPNFKEIALFLQKLLGGPKTSKLGHVHQATPTLGVSLYSLRWRGSVLQRCTQFDADRSVRLKVINGVSKFGN